MILACPSCNSRFRVDADKLPTQGRTVRCSKCGHTWHATPTTAEAEAQAAPESAATPEEPLPRALRGEPPEPEAGAGQAGEGDTDHLRSGRRRRSLHPESEAPRPRRRRTALGWLILLLVIAGLAAGLWYGRNHVVAQVPQAARLYEMAGIPVHTVAPDLELRDVTRRRQLDGERHLLIIEGRIVNTASHARPVPDLRVELVDEAGETLSSWSFSSEADRLPAGGETRFKTQRTDPPAEARELSLTFVPPGS